MVIKTVIQCDACGTWEDYNGLIPDQWTTFRFQFQRSHPDPKAATMGMGTKLLCTDCANMTFTNLCIDQFKKHFRELDTSCKNNGPIFTEE